MSLTLLQRFYEIAKQEAEAPALGVDAGESFQSLPWWFVKSRVKHFGLGLLEAGARPGDYFYLLPGRHPTWIYSELGALSMGLKTLPLPAGLPRQRLEQLFANYPPAFLYWGEGHPENFSWQSYKTLKAVVTPSEDSLHPEKRAAPFRSFREVFNSGIQFESKHHAAYRQIRDTLQENNEMSPIWVDRTGGIVERPLRYQDVNQTMTRLSQVFRIPKTRRILSDVDFWWTEGRMIGVYWPLFLALQAIHCWDPKQLVVKMQATRPDMAFLGDSGLERLAQELSPRLGSENPLGIPWSKFGEKWRALRQARWLRRQLGGKLRLLVGTSPLAPALRNWLTAGKIRTISVAEIKDIPS